MARLRGDDDILSLMGEMASQQGYDEPAVLMGAPATSSSAKTTTAPMAPVRLIQEVEGYPSNNRLAGSDAIWNPYIQISLPPTTKCPLVATNPQVEVFRRRAFERFKSDFRSCLEKIGANATKQGPSNLWKELSPVSIMERWHFDAKLQEFLHIGSSENAISTSRGMVSTSEIKLAMERDYVDPILISSDARGGRKRKRGDKHTSSPFRSASSLLADEVEFEWTRAWKRIAGDKFKEIELKQIFQSKKFKRKLSNLTRSVMEAASQVQASFHEQVSKRAALEAHQSSNSKKPSIPKIAVEEEDVFVKFSGLSFKLNVEHYRKLQILFDRQHHSTSTDRPTHEATFASCLFCLLCRYDMLQGAGLQSSMHGAVFDVLLKHFDCRLECFASPLNSRYERFCSAFFDTDAAFGSVASFFDYDFSRGGCFQANPPFATNFIACMYETMEQALSSCESPLMFVVFVPAWKETVGWKLLNESSYLTKSVVLSQSSHYYCEGTQHRRKDRYRVASFDTSVFFLQNQAARTKWEITESHVDDLKSAFAVDPTKSEANQCGNEAAVGNEPRTEQPSTVAKAAGTDECTTSTKRNESPSRKSKKKKKRVNQKKKILSEGEEGAQQLDILNSLGIGDPTPSAGSSNRKSKRK